MRPGIDIRVDAQSDGRDPVHRGGDPGDGLELALALDVEHQDARFQPRDNLVVRLAHAREDGPLRVASRQLHPMELAPRDDVKAAAVLGHHLQDAQVRIGFHRVTDQRIDVRERRAK